MKTIIAFLLSISLSCFLGGCVSTHNEIQHFKSDGSHPNYYRLKISTHSFFSKAKYSSGFYDERALDIFLNEASKQDEQEESSDAPPTKSDGEVNDSIETLENNGGVFAFIYSANVDAVTNAIGSFSDQNSNSDMLVSLLNNKKTTELETRKYELEKKSNKVEPIFIEIDALFGLIPDQLKEGEEPDDKKYLYILNAISRALGDGREFKNFDAAQTYFSNIRRD